MRRIIYTSHAGPELDRAELIRLLYHARTANEANGLSGVLLQSEGRLYQVLEGRTWALFATFEKIRSDLRHRNVALLWERSIPQATFPRWPMRYFDERNFGKAVGMMTAEAGGVLPDPIAATLRDFVVESFTAPSRAPISLSPPEAGRPSSPRLC